MVGNVRYPNQILVVTHEIARATSSSSRCSSWAPAAQAGLRSDGRKTWGGGGFRRLTELFFSLTNLTFNFGPRLFIHQTVCFMGGCFSRVKCGDCFHFWGAPTPPINTLGLMNTGSALVTFVVQTTGTPTAVRLFWAIHSFGSENGVATDSVRKSREIILEKNLGRFGLSGSPGFKGDL